MKKLPIIKSISKRQLEIISYLFFGGLTTLVNFVVYIFFVQLIGLGIPAGNAIAWVAGVLFAFVTNKLWVFQSKSWMAKQVLREAGTFIGARITTGLLDMIGVPLLFYIGLNYPLFGIEGFTAKLMITVLVIILNYVFSKTIVFRSGDR